MKNSTRPLWNGRVVLLLILICVVGAAHLWQLSDLPQGLYHDESAIGYNANLVARTGYDEHHHFLPLFFQSFNDYKAPVYIYAVALVFRILGVSEGTLRLTSFLFFAIFLWSVTTIARRLDKKCSLALTLFALIEAGFLPWVFTMSRIAFEVISQPALTALALLFILRTYDRKMHQPYRNAAAAGLILAISLYTYPTGRVLALLFLGFTLAVYARRATLKRSITLLIAFLAGLLPYIVYSLLNSGVMTERFRSISYVFDTSLSFLQKTHIFFENYTQYFSLSFLFLHGDGNLRHATGFGGEIYWILAILAVVGALWILAGSHPPQRKFGTLLILGALSAPVGAALTSQGTPHALRSVLMGLFVLLLSFYGFLFFSKVPSRAPRWMIMLIPLMILSYESGTYTYDYFTRYVPVSANAFEYANVRQALFQAAAIHPASIIVDNNINYTEPLFYSCTSPFSNISVKSTSVHPVTDGCVVYLPEDGASLTADLLQVDLPTINGLLTKCFSSKAAPIAHGAATDGIPSVGPTGPTFP